MGKFRDYEAFPKAEVLIRLDCIQLMVMTKDCQTTEIFLTVLNPGFMQRGGLDECLKYVGDHLFTQLEEAMVGLELKTSASKSANIRDGTVAEELKTFVERCKQCLCGWGPSHANSHQLYLISLPKKKRGIQHNIST